MAKTFQGRINTTELFQVEQEKDFDQERIDTLLEKKDEDDDNDEKIERCNFIQKILRTISIGQYDTKLYTSKGHNTFSTSFGGIMTIIITTLLLSYGLYVMINIFSMKTYILDQQSGEIRTSHYDNVSK